MLQQVFSSGNGSPVTLNRITQMVNSGSLNIPSTNTYRNDQIRLSNPQSLGIPATSTSFNYNNVGSPIQQLTNLGRRYGIQFTGDMNDFQKRVIKALIMHKSMQYGVPMQIALGVAGNESGWKMWTDVNNGTPVQGKNIRDGVLKSTDWGVMQINDSAHKKAFPRVKTDIEYNIEYGLQFLANRRQQISGSLGHGFGDWDRTIASYNLGHSPKTQRDYEIAQKYVSNVKKRSLSA